MGRRDEVIYMIRKQTSFLCHVIVFWEDEFPFSVATPDKVSDPNVVERFYGEGIYYFIPQGEYWHHPIYYVIPQSTHLIEVVKSKM